MISNGLVVINGDLCHWSKYIKLAKMPPIPILFHYISFFYIIDCIIVRNMNMKIPMVWEGYSLATSNVQWLLKA
jgi:hypothetical protein